MELIIPIAIGVLVVFLAGVWTGIMAVYYFAIKPAIQSKTLEWDGNYYQLSKRRKT